MQAEKIDPHRRKYEKGIERVRSSAEVPEEDRELILAFDEKCAAESIGFARRAGYVNHLYLIRKMLNKPFREASKRDIERILAEVAAREVSQWTVQGYKITLKKFYKWLLGKDEEYPENVRWIRTTVRNNQLPRDSLLSEEDIEKLLRACDNPRDRAIILVLAESGMRAGELLSLKIGHVRFDQYGAIVTVKGKTGDRAVRLIASAPALSLWLENHPRRNDPQAPLWVNIGTKLKGTAMTYNGLQSLTWWLGKRANIGKRVHPHAFRHTAATRLARLLTEAEMKQYLGWVQSSKMAGIYVHLASRDVDKTLLRIHGLLSEEEDQERKMVAIKCPRCKQRNSFGAKFCSYCGLPLDIRSAMEVDEKRKRSEKILNLLSKDPEFVEFMRRKVNELMEEGLLEGI